ncbi:organic radical activating enzyme [Candidatus Nitrososphaera evergladensis SR1]|jgi:7-carboxy-7-deazaguanine synthase|uniref:7-carboxy-7-deazaguanine synthase n=2 Tax=Nitrososphaera TaxID=497726 RepID=A0A075MZY3_9ARCH|nr:organic radical activating enzyme [Candidatus Nitrososphaera evergladensis SR1]
MQREQQGRRTAGTVRLSEIFTSIEGEGVFFGTKTMFVRLAGCPLKCHWCDTPYAIPMDSGESHTVEEVKEMISNDLQENTYKVNFTGGEPLAQHEAVMELAKFVREKKGVKTYLESACYDSARFAKVLPYIDICKIEFKMKDARAVVDDKHYNNLLKNELECLRIAVDAGKMPYVKVVVTNSTDVDEFASLVRQVFRVASPKNIAGFIIQPSHKTDEPVLERLFAFYDAVYPFYDQVRVVPQLHKIIGAR